MPWLSQVLNGFLSSYNAAHPGAILNYVLTTYVDNVAPTTRVFNNSQGKAPLSCVLLKLRRRVWT